MSYQIERTAPCRIGLTAAVGADEVAKERERVVASWARAAHIDGFRKGKAPRSLVERRFASQIREELEERLTRQVWDEVRQAENLRPASPLGVREAAVLDDGGFRMQGELDVYPTVELPPLDGFAPPEFDLEPKAEEITEAMDQLRERQAAWEPVENEPAAAGMLVEAEVHGEFPDGDGEPFHEERSLFQLGSGEVYAEIEAAVTGRGSGEEVTAERTIGEEGAKERQGKRTAYRIRIKSLRRKRLPEVDDAFAQSLGADAGIEELRKRVQERLRDGKIEHRREVWRDALVRHLAGEAPLPLPERLVAEETREEVVKFARTLAQRGVDPERAELDWKKIEADLRGRVEERLRTELLLDALADTQGVEVSAGEVDHEVEQQARRLGTPFAELKGNLAKSGGLERVGAILRRARAADAVLQPHEKGA
jgi:trigger factor